MVFYEYIEAKDLPEYGELTWKGHRIPFTKFMFPVHARVEIFFEDLVNLSKEGHGLVEGTTRVDAYSISNDQVESYIECREKVYRQVKDILEMKDYDVDRDFLGSEDGEAIIYRKKASHDWHIFAHLDPSLCQSDDIEAVVKEFFEEEIE